MTARCDLADLLAQRHYGVPLDRLPTETERKLLADADAILAFVREFDHDDVHAREP
jgi:hypothetical protein